MLFVAQKLTKEQQAIADWFEAKHIKWRNEQPRGKDGVTQFAAFIGISRDVLNSYMLYGAKPDGDNLVKVAVILGDEIYDLIKKPKPDPKRDYAKWLALTLPDDSLEGFVELGDKIRKDENKSSEKPKRPSTKTGA